MPKERSLRIASSSAAIPTGPRAHSHLQASHATQSPRLPTGPSASRHESKAAAVKQEPETPVSAGSMKQEATAMRIPVSIPTTKLYDPVSEEDKIRRQKFKEEKKREEARGRELQRQLDQAMHEYEMARLDLVAIEKRRALAEAQLERLNEIDVV